MNKKLIKTMSVLAIGSTLATIGGSNSFADVNLDNKNLYGTVSIASEFGEEEITSGYIYKKKRPENLLIEDDYLLYYGIPALSGNKESDKETSQVESFIDWLTDYNLEFAKLFENKAVGTKEFDDTWKQLADNHDDEFAEAQQQFIFEKNVAPAIKYYKDKYNIDFTKNRALEELLFALISDIGEYETLNIVEKAILHNNLSEKSSSDDIIDDIQRYRVDTVSSSSLDFIEKHEKIQSIESETYKLKTLTDEESLTSLKENGVATNNKSFLKELLANLFSFLKIN